MGEMRRSKAGYDSSLGTIAKRLRGEDEHITREPLPERWVDLINYLDEQERKRARGDQPRAEPRTVGSAKREDL